MNIRTQRLCLWCGPLMLFLFLLGFGVVAQFIPPPNPLNPADEVARHYRDNATSIRIGMEITMFAGALCTPWVAALAVQMKRIEGELGPLTLTMYGFGILLPLEFINACYFFMTASYRADRDPGTVQTLNDLGWLPFDGMIYTFVLQTAVIGIAALVDKREQPIWPRWFGFFSLWAALLMAPASLNVFFKEGPLAWNGAISWWLLVIVFLAWIVQLTSLTFKAIAAQEAESNLAVASSGSAV